MQARRLILTADDFGRSPEVNAAIESWYHAGALTQASLMVNEAAAQDAVKRAREMPGLQIGLHLALCDGLASDGSEMPRSPAWAGLRYAFSAKARAWMAREIQAQFAKFAELGFSRPYWDGHAHLHMHPAVMGAALPLARGHGFAFMRLVREPGSPALIPAIFQLLSKAAIPRLRAAGVDFADRVFGLRRSGRMDRTEVRRALALSQTGTTEIYFHPGAESGIDPLEVAQLVRDFGVSASAKL